MRSVRQIRWFHPILLITPSILILASCSDPYTARLEQNQQRWRSQNIADYRFTLKMQCYCPIQYLGPNIIEVRHGVADSITYSGESRNIDMSGVQLPDTMDKLFNIIRSSRNATVTYDPTLGYPTSIHVVYRGAGHHNYTIYSVTDFEVRR